MADVTRRRRVAVLLCLMTLAVLAGCASGDRASDNDQQRPVFYGGVSGAPYTK